MQIVRWLLYSAPFLIFLLITIWSIKNGIGPNPSSSKQVKAILDLIDPQTKGVLFELGSGWGTLAIALSRRFPDIQIIGYESSPVPFLFSRLLNFFYRLKNLKFYWRNIFKVNLGDASVIVCYLHRKPMRRLREKFDRELNPGTVVVSNTFSLPDSTPDTVITVDDFFRTKIYRYRM